MREQFVQLYNAAMHKIQSIIAFRITRGDTLASPKHLRVGVDSALVSNEALVRLLAKKGLITRDEYMDSLLECTVEEADREEARAREEYGLPDNVSFK